MDNTPHPLDLNATLERIEPGVSPLPPEIALASIAISMKRMADMLHLYIPVIDGRLVGIKDTISHVNGNAGMNISSAVNGINSSISSLSGQIYGVTLEVRKLTEKLDVT